MNKTNKTDNQEAKNTSTEKKMQQYKRITGTAYIVLADGNVARLLTPSKKQEKIYFSVRINEKTKYLSADDIKSLAE